MAIAWPEILKFRGQQLKSNLGFSGLIGVLAFSVGCLTIWNTQHLTGQMSEISRKIIDKQKILQSTDKASVIPAANFELPLVSTYESILKNIILLTEKNTISLIGGSYSVKTLENSKIRIVEITFPLSGTYLQLKNFLVELLNTVPNASLQTVKVSQPNKTSALLDAEIVVLLYFSGTSG